MPRPTKAARLWWKPSTGEWIILDAGRQVRTGHRGGSREKPPRGAEEALARYVLARVDDRPPASPSEITCGEILALYVQGRAQGMSAPRTLAHAVTALSDFWGNLPVSAVKGATCRRYERHRAKPRRVEDSRGQIRAFAAGQSTVRRELGVLQAAINHALREGALTSAVLVTLPEAGAAKDRWLERREVRAMLRQAAPHIRRFIVASLLTGTRKTAVLRTRLVPSLDTGWMDLERGIWHRRGGAERETKKRRGSVRMPAKLLRIARRWARSGDEWLVAYNGRPVSDIDTGFHAARDAAGLGPDVTPHTLKHTAVTWAFQDGMTREDAAEYFDTSTQTLERVYRAHSPEHQSRASEIMNRRRR